MGARAIDTYCHQCHMKCHVLAHLQDGRIREIRRATCVKGRYAHEDVRHPGRLRYPLKRLGPQEEARSTGASRPTPTLSYPVTPLTTPSMATIRCGQYYVG